MTNRRAFLMQAALAAGTGVLSTGISDAKDVQQRRSAARSLRMLVLGGTGYIGPHFVRAALERGHRVAVFSRGKSEAELPSTVERLVGDRDGDLKSLQKREWDAVLDLAAYQPDWVRSLGHAIKKNVRHYTFISTIAVYVHHGAGAQTDESTELREQLDSDPEQPYATDKVRCEREAERQFPGRTLILRPTYMAGPADRVGPLTYLAARIRRGGEMLAAGDALSPVQVIDVRDVAQWAIRLAEAGETGAYNAVGPATAMGWAEMLGLMRGVLDANVQLTWVPLQWVADRNIGLRSNLLFWPSQGGFPGHWRMSNANALAKGLSLRPLSRTITDILAWYDALSPELQKNALPGFNDLGPTDGRDGLETFMARERELLAAWHANHKSSARRDDPQGQVAPGLVSSLHDGFGDRENPAQHLRSLPA